LPIENLWFTRGFGWALPDFGGKQTFIAYMPRSFFKNAKKRLKFSFGLCKIEEEYLDAAFELAMKSKPVTPAPAKNCSCERRNLCLTDCSKGSYTK
jgi:hypothetical protein